jgi:DNA polymerase
MIRFGKVMTFEALKKEWDHLQKQYGDPALTPIYGAGCLHHPDICFVFMNPTGKNVSSDPSWKGLRAPWIGTKNVWKLFAQLGLLPKKMYEQICLMPADTWDPLFAYEVYQQIANHRVYITNLAKSTQKDARHLSDQIFRAYLPSFHQELLLLKPKHIITFGNQVSSVLLDRSVCVSQTRKQSFPLSISHRTFQMYPTYYPVGQGMRNMSKAVEDILWIMNLAQK